MRWTLALLIPAAMADARTAEACSQPRCWPGAFLPGDGAAIPANAPGLYWRPTTGFGSEVPVPDPATVRLTATSDPATPLAFTATAQPNGDFVLTPSEPLVAGASYVLEETTKCDGAGARVQFTAGPSAPLPTTLGTVAVIAHGQRGPLEVSTVAGSCSTEIDAVSIAIELAPSPTAAPWLPLMLFETEVDDQRWSAQTSIRDSSPPGASWTGRGRDRLYRMCGESPDRSDRGLTEGGHSAAFHATIPNTSATLATPPQLVELTCAIDPPEDPGDDVDHSSGCSTTGATGSTLLGLALLGLRRRRR